MLFIHIVSVICSILLGSVIYFSGLYSLPKVIDLLSLAIVILFIWMIASWLYAEGTFFDPYGLFIMASFAFNGGQALLEVFGLNRNGILHGVFPDESIIKSLFMVIIGMASMHLGALAAGALFRFSSEDDVGLHRTEINLRVVGLGLLAISIIPAFIMFQHFIRIVMESGYFGIFAADKWIGAAATPQLLGTFLVPAALLLLAGSHGHRWGITISIATLSVYVPMMFFLGNRGDATMALLAFMWLWHRRVFEIPRWLIISSGLLLMGVILPLVGMTREISGTDRSSLMFMTSSLFDLDNPLITAVSEMGNSMNTIAYTLDLVPSTKPFEGMTTLYYAVLTVIPNLYWDLHPSIAYGTPSHWLVQTVDPYRAAQGGGMGFSFIAETYYNFGWLGVPVHLIVFGLLLGLFVKWGNRKGHPAKMACLACFLVFFLQYARGDLALIFRSMVWYSLLPYMAVIVLNRIRYNR
jgi:oligosaccharide repeat unit polymerase